MALSVNPTNRRALPAALAMLLLGAGCSHLFLSYYDATTYKSLTDLKPEVAALYETFTDDAVDQEQVAAMSLRFNQVFEYEKGKGKANAETARQIDIIRTMFKRHVEDRMLSGTWSPTHRDNNLANINEAFDIAIATERLKNRNR